MLLIELICHRALLHFRMLERAIVLLWGQISNRSTKRTLHVRVYQPYNAQIPYSQPDTIFKNNHLQNTSQIQ
jgi:hypothetical protein